MVCTSIKPSKLDNKPYLLSKCREKNFFYSNYKTWIEVKKEVKKVKK